MGAECRMGQNKESLSRGNMELTAAVTARAREKIGTIGTGNYKAYRDAVG